MRQKRFLKIVKKIIQINKDTFFHWKNFGFHYASSFFFTSFFQNKKYQTRKMAIRLCDNEYHSIFEYWASKTNDLTGVDSSKSEKNIFVFWAQGFNNLPFFQKEVLSRITYYYSDYNIIRIDLDNYFKYVDLDKNLVSLFKKGNITIQTFSDILRFNLIYKFGGIWCDMTLLFFKRYDLFELVNQYGFYSLNHQSKEKDKIWGRVFPVTYTTFFFGAKKGCGVMGACVDFYNQYYQDHNYAIDYFMNDYSLILCMKYNIDNSVLDKIPKTVGNPFYLANALEENAAMEVSRIELCPQKVNWRNLSDEKLKKSLEFIIEKQKEHLK